MDYVTEVFRRADFSKETTLMNRLRRQLFPVREISFDELKKKNDMDKKTGEISRKSVSRSREHTKNDVLDRKVPGKNGPHM